MSSWDLKPHTDLCLSQTDLTSLSGHRINTSVEMDVSGYQALQSELKRKATSDLPHRAKKASRITGQDSVSVSSETEYSDEDEHDNNDDDENPNESGTTTPLTSHSTKQNPSWPSRQKTIPCTFPGCSKMFNRQAKLQDHLRSHNNDRKYVCPEPGCGKSFLRKTHLDRHIKSAHTEERDFVCSFEGCGKAFSTGTRLRRHEAQHVQRQEYACSDCGKEFRKQVTLQRHVDTDHKGELPYVCEYELKDGSTCGARFLKAAGLQSHHRRLHDEKCYWCEICIVSDNPSAPAAIAEDEQDRSDACGFSTYSQYRVHMREMHPPSCDICGTVCQTIKLLTRHKELEHGIIPATAAKKPVFTCPEPGCMKVFSKKGNMDVHVRSVHTKQRPFVCGQVDLSALNHVEGWDGLDACGHDFKAKSQLEDHIRTAHLGLKTCAQTRKAAKLKDIEDNAPQDSSTSQPANKDMVSFITGMGYSENAKRDIECLVIGCRFRFSRQYDCDLHYQLVHGVDSDDVEYQPMSSFDGSSDQPPFIGRPTPEDARHTSDQPDIDYMLELEQNARQGVGAFWIGGNPPGEARRLIGEGHADALENAQEEMSRLIGSGNGWEDDIIMDPALRED